MWIVAEVHGERAAEALAVLRPFCVADARLLTDARPTSTGLTVSPPAELRAVDERLAQRIAEALNPTGKKTSRRDALRVILGEERLLDGMLARHEGGNDAMRNAVVGVSKTLRRFAPGLRSPVELLAEREREQRHGNYRQPLYRPNELGLRVRDILIERGQL